MGMGIREFGWRCLHARSLQVAKVWRTPAAAVTGVLLALTLSVAAGGGWAGATTRGTHSPADPGGTLAATSFWMAVPTGTVYSFGHAVAYGSAGGLSLSAPIVDLTPTADAKGYWELGSDGGIFSYGDATFYGSTGAIRLNKPIVGLTPTVDGKGYWLVASDGGIFSSGDATFQGSMGAKPLNAPVVGMAAAV